MAETPKPQDAAAAHDEDAAQAVAQTTAHAVAQSQDTTQAAAQAQDAAQDTAQAAAQTQATAQAALQKLANGFFYCKVYSPYQTYFNGYVKSVSAENETGPFDILAKHRNFLTLLTPCNIVIRNIENSPPGHTETIKIARAIMQVKPHETIVFLDI